MIVVNISGPKDVGKSILGGFIVNYLNDQDTGLKAECFRWADTVYQMAAAFTGDRKFIGSQAEREEAKRSRYSIGEGVTITGTEILQKIGTEGGRDVFGEDVWVYRGISQAERQAGVDVAIFDDCRFPNEQRAGHYNIYLEPNFPLISAQNIKHRSEQNQEYLRQNADAIIKRFPAPGGGGLTKSVYSYNFSGVVASINSLSTKGASN